MQRPVCTDNFGNEVYRSEFSGSYVTVGTDLKMFPSIVPNVRRGCVGRDDEMPLWKESAHLFHGYEANCNTCIHLQRRKHPKNPAGFLFGYCAKGNQTMYSDPEGIMFHPEDPMHMSCHEQRPLK